VPGAECVRGDLVTGEGLDEALRGVDTVLHLAGTTKAISGGFYQLGNVQTMKNLLRVSAHVRRLVYVSSLAAAGPSPTGEPLTEEDPPHPVSDYGRSKLEAEQLVLASDLLDRVVIVRPPVVFGPRDTGVFRILASVARGWMPRIGSGERLFSYIYVKDLVAGLLAAAQSGKAPGKTYFLCAPAPVTWNEFATAAAEIMACRVRTLRVPMSVAYAMGLAGEAWSRLTRKPGILSRDKIREARNPFWVCGAGRAARELAFRAETPLRLALAETLAWYKEAGWLTY
jgi:nucleoside-diphosphate-sugar epimerase